MKSFQNLSYSQGGFAASVTLAVLIKVFHQIF
ncbi:MULTISPECIES: DUF4027 family protein [Bacillus cereus group]|nr:DUF4027 family protein [Bacillus cereus]